MPGVPRELIEHSLNVHPKVVPKKQHLQRFAHDKREAIKREIAKLLAVGFIKEVIHAEWVANPVLVRKKNNEWRMCVDYTDLNKHCPKDHFGLPRIDQVVDSTAGCVLLCFLDCYSRYHQIETLKPMWMTWSSRPKILMVSLQTWKKHSAAYAGFGGSSTQLNVSLEYHQGNCLGSSSASGELKPTL
jgi:hypothetical protein